MGSLHGVGGRKTVVLQDASRHSPGLPDQTAACKALGGGLGRGQNSINSTDVEMKVPCWKHWVDINT